MWYRGAAGYLGTPRSHLRTGCGVEEVDREVHAIMLKSDREVAIAALRIGRSVQRRLAVLEERFPKMEEGKAARRSSHRLSIVDGRVVYGTLGEVAYSTMRAEQAEIALQDTRRQQEEERSKYMEIEAKLEAIANLIPGWWEPGMSDCDPGIVKVGDILDILGGRKT